MKQMSEIEYQNYVDKKFDQFDSGKKPMTLSDKMFLDSFNLSSGVVRMLIKRMKKLKG